VGVRSQCEDLIKKAVEEMKGIDLLFLNAGIAMGAALFNVKDASLLEQVMNINFYGAMNTCFFCSTISQGEFRAYCCNLLCIRQISSTYCFSLLCFKACLTWIL